MNKNISNIFIVSLLLFAFYCTLQMGMTSDVLFHYGLGKERLDYLLSFGSQEISDNITVKKFYPGAYSTISAFIVQFFPKNYLIEAIYSTNLIFSFFSIIGIYKVTKELFNEIVGKITFLLCFFNPIFFGHMGINGIDTIISFANIWFLYFMLRYLRYQNINQKRNAYIILGGLCLGLGLGVRYTFFATLLPFALFAFIALGSKSNIRGKNFSIKKLFNDFLKLIVISYLFVVLFWPNTHENIFTMPFKLIIESFSFGFGVPLLLFNGETFLANTFPKNYLLLSLFYKMPEYIILSILIFVFFILKKNSLMKKEFKNLYLKISLILFIILFPNIILLASPYGVYDGIRLFLYLIPFICIIPALLLYCLLKEIKFIINKLILSILVLLKIVFLYSFFILTPYQYVYSNIFTGNFSENHKKFENDYWGVSTRKLIAMIEQSDDIPKNKKIIISTCGVEKNAQVNYLKKIKNLNFKMVNNYENFDYIIMNNRLIYDEKNLKNYKNAETCFQRFIGNDLVVIKRNGLIISKITKVK